MKGRFQMMCEKEINIMIKDVEILKGYLQNSCKSFAFFVSRKELGRGVR
jgi:hypothetical protein